MCLVKPPSLAGVAAVLLAKDVTTRRHDRETGRGSKKTCVTRVLAGTRHFFH
ncbi:hypothetical protein [Kitasatospora sp. MAA4]|uniref:hypothetical protein n=1 Tax=Kitasatospora sp. MAA4 TaxID=3035093 RepID=UPI00247499DE|nr:hypothetical protein [Kitasatospora sp. MAA4]